MRIRTMILMMFVILLMMPNSGLASPGITVTLNPLTKSTQNDVTVDYEVIIINEDGKIENGNCIENCIDQTITNLVITQIPSEWEWTIDPLQLNYISAGEGNQLTTTLHITPHGASEGIYNLQIEGSSDGIFSNYLFHMDNSIYTFQQNLVQYLINNGIILNEDELSYSEISNNRIVLYISGGEYTYINNNNYIYEILPFSLSSSDPEDFITIITGSSPAPIPEFPTVALPIISVLGLMFLLRKNR